MVDFLRSNPWCSREEYTWGLTVAQIRLASADFTHVEYIDEKEKNTTYIGFDDGGVELDGMNIPTIGGRG